MIRSFADPRVERFFRDGICPARWQAFENIAKRSLDMLDAAAKLSDLHSPSGNRLESLGGGRQEQHHDQFRVCFRWTDQGPTDVEVVDNRLGQPCQEYAHIPVRFSARNSSPRSA